MLIQTFADKETEKVYHQKFSKKLPQSIQKIVSRKFMMIDAARDINDQYRICFTVQTTNYFYNEDYVLLF